MSIEDLAKIMAQGFLESDKKIGSLTQTMNKGFLEMDEKINNLAQNTAEGFSEMNDRFEGLARNTAEGFSEVHEKIDFIDKKLVRVEVGLNTLGNRMDTAFGKAQEKFVSLDRRVLKLEKPAGARN